MTSGSRETNGIVQVLKLADGSHAGMAILIDDRHVITCAHVINQARNVDVDANQPPDPESEFAIRFLFPKPQTGRGRVVRWGLSGTHESVDLALLELLGPKPADVACATLENHDGQRVTDWKVCGIHDKENEPYWTKEDGTRVSAPTQGDSVQLECGGVAGRLIDHGDSGAGVWCRDLQAVIGMVVNKHRNIEEQRICAMIPVSVIRKFHPPSEQPGEEQGWPEEEFRSTIQTKIKDVLNSMKPSDRTLLTKRLAEELFENGKATLKLSVDRCVEEISSHLAQCKSDQQLAASVKLYRKMKLEGERDSYGSLHTIILTILPLEIPSELLAAIWKQIHLGKMALISARIERPQIVELVMAGVHLKPAVLEKGEKGFKTSALICELPAPKKAVKDDDWPEEMALAILNSLCDPIISKPIEDGTISERIEIRTQELEGILVGRNQLLEIKGRRSYCILERFRDERDRAIFKEAIKYIDTDRLGLLFVEVARPGESELRKKEAFLLTILNGWFSDL